MKKVRVDIVSSTFEQKRFVRCSYQALKYNIVYFDENCQAAIIFNNLAALT